MFLDISETVPVTSISDANFFHLCKYNLLQSPWYLSTLSFKCAFIWSTSVTCKASSKEINISFCGAFCPSCSMLLCWYVGVLTCDEPVGVVRSGWFVVLFVVCCKNWQTFFVFVHGLNSSFGNLKRFDSLTAAVDFEGVFFLGWSYLWTRIFVKVTFCRDSAVSAIKSPKRKFLESSLISAKPNLVAGMVLSCSSWTGLILDLLSL